MTEYYDIGDKPTITATFKTAGGVLGDPSTVTLTVKDPAGNVTTPSMTRASAGIYTYQLSLISAGLWQYKIVGAGNDLDIAEEGSYFVRPQLSGGSTYIGPTTSDKDRVRFTVGDTGPSEWLLTDSEIEWLLTENPSVIEASIEACKHILAKFSKQMDRTIGPFSLNIQSRYDHYSSLIKSLEAKAAMNVGATVQLLGSADTGGFREHDFVFGAFDNRSH